MRNAGAYIPLLEQNQMHDLQTAANARIRAVCRLPKRGQAPMTLREQLGIPSVELIRCRVLFWTEAWKKKPTHAHEEGPTTRGRSAGNVPVRDLRGWIGKKFRT